MTNNFRVPMVIHNRPFNFRTFVANVSSRVGSTIKLGANKFFTACKVGLQNFTATMRRLGVAIKNVSAATIKGMKGFVYSIGEKIRTRASAIRTKRATRAARATQSTSATSSTPKANTAFEKAKRFTAKVYDKYRDTTYNIAKKITPQFHFKNGYSKHLNNKKDRVNEGLVRTVDRSIRAGVILTAYGVGKVTANAIANSSSKEDKE